MHVVRDTMYKCEMQISLVEYSVIDQIIFRGTSNTTPNIINECGREWRESVGEEEG